MFDFHNTTHPLTSEQQPIVGHKAKGNLIVVAGAGCGKTHTLTAYAKARQNKTILAVAYNTRIQESMARKMPPNVTCLTLHSLMYAHARFVGKFEVDMKLELNYLKERNRGYENSELYNMSRELQSFLAAAPTSREEFIQVYASRKKPEPFFSWDNFQLMRDELLSMKQTSFPLMVSEFVLASRPRMNAFDEILVDEAQDLDPGLLNVLRKIRSAFPAKFVFVGDPLQSIYGFKGALPRIMDRVKQEFQCEGFPLQTCFRCPEAVIERLKARFPRSRLIAHKKGGVVNSVPWEDLHLAIREGSKAYIARTNAQLMQRSLDLVKRSIPHTFAASDIGQRMLKMIESPRFDIERCRLKAAKLVTDSEELEAEAAEKVDAELTLAVLASRCPTVAALKKEIHQLFLHIKGKEALVLITAHGSKGLEWDTVFIETARLGQARKGASEDEKVQEENLLYVAYTRTLKNLFLVR